VQSSGVLGPAITDAERAEQSGVVDGVSCSGTAQQVYLSSTFRLVARAATTSDTARGNHLDSKRSMQPSDSAQVHYATIGMDDVGDVFDVAPPELPRC
jgi:hypothetical protein